MSTQAGNLLRDLREQADLTQEALARKLGVSVRTVRRIEAGDTWSPGLRQLVASAFRIEAADLPAPKRRTRITAEPTPQPSTEETPQPKKTLRVGNIDTGRSFFKAMVGADEYDAHVSEDASSTTPSTHPLLIDAFVDDVVSGLDTARQWPKLTLQQRVQAERSLGRSLQRLRDEGWEISYIVSNHGQDDGRTVATLRLWSPAAQEADAAAAEEHFAEQERQEAEALDEAAEEYFAGRERQEAEADQQPTDKDPEEEKQ